jgi:hypothetical protein
VRSKLKFELCSKLTKGEVIGGLVKKMVWGNVRSYICGDVPGYQEISLPR